MDYKMKYAQYIADSPVRCKQLINHLLNQERFTAKRTRIGYYKMCRYPVKYTVNVVNGSWLSIFVYVARYEVNPNRDNVAILEYIMHYDEYNKVINNPAL